MAMRIVNGVLCVLFVLAVIVQYNDPDGPLWMAIYAVPAAWTGFAAFRPDRLLSRTATVGLGICVALAIVGTVFYWPPDAEFWRQEIWWNNELDREGMGMMIVTLGLLFVAFDRWRLGARRHATA